jgi:hypothetical protein
MRIKFSILLCLPILSSVFWLEPKSLGDTPEQLKSMFPEAPREKDLSVETQVKLQQKAKNLNIQIREKSQRLTEKILEAKFHMLKGNTGEALKAVSKAEALKKEIEKHQNDGRAAVNRARLISIARKSKNH